MLEYIVIGCGLAFAATVSPGPFQAYLLSRVATMGWRRTLPASFAPLLSDGPIAVLALLVLGRLSLTMQGALRASGGLLLLYFAWRTVRQYRQYQPVTVTPGNKVPKTLFEAALVNLLNPNPYLGWAMVLGPAVVTAWQNTPINGVAVVIAFYATMITLTGLLIAAFGSTRLFSSTFQRMLVLVSALVLTGLGIYQLVISIAYVS